MRWILWSLMVATVAVVSALLLGSHQSNVTLYWHPWRVDLSLNLVLMVLVVLFVLLYAALRGAALLRELPQRAQKWRAQQSERAAFTAVLDAVAFQLSGRFVRAQSSASRALSILQEHAEQPMPQQDQLVLLAQLLSAESANALGNTEQREAMLQAVENSEALEGTQAIREGTYIRAASWAIDTKDAERARHWLAQLPQGAQRRIQAVRLRLKLAQLDRNNHHALDMVRLLVKHKALSAFAASTLSRSLALEALHQVHDLAQLEAAWQRMDEQDREQPALVLALIHRWQVLLAVDPVEPSAALRAMLDQAIQTLWKVYPELSDSRRIKALLILDDECSRQPAQWLSAIEQALVQKPNDVGLQFLAGRVFLRQQLWGKAQAQLTMATKQLQDAELLRRAWCGLAELAEQREDTAAALTAWKQAATQ